MYVILIWNSVVGVRDLFVLIPLFSVRLAAICRYHLSLKQSFQALITMARRLNVVIVE